jgi:hypothetical protein
MCVHYLLRQLVYLTSLRKPHDDTPISMSSSTSRLVRKPSENCPASSLYFLFVIFVLGIFDVRVPRSSKICSASSVSRDAFVERATESHPLPRRARLQKSDGHPLPTPASSSAASSSSSSRPIVTCDTALRSSMQACAKTLLLIYPPFPTWFCSEPHSGYSRTYERLTCRTSALPDHLPSQRQAVAHAPKLHRSDL